MASAASRTENSVDLSRQFLLAMPGMADDEWAHSVVYLCEHNEQGALGLIVNRPTDVTVGDLLGRLDITVTDAGQSRAALPVYFGGPVHTDRGFVLHGPGRKYHSSIDLGEMVLTTSRDVLEDIARGEGPAQFLVTLGYAGWGTGQLESELAANAWLNVVATSNVVFDTAPETRYESALGALGIQSAMLTGVAGHA